MKDEAYEFLKTLHSRLDLQIGPPPEVSKRIRELNDLGRQDPKFAFYRGTEGAFVAGIALPAIYDELMTTFRYSAEQARKSLYAEGYRNFSEIAINTPARWMRHPFSKVLVSNARDIYSQWAGRKAGAALKQSCPDFALRDPCSHNIIFEAKYFKENSCAAAERELVATCYQAFFYRGLPENLDAPGRPWGYDYAVAFVYDASPDGYFEAAWEALPSEVKRGFWGGANVYVMVLRGTQA
ncbi:MAG: hypothetical protein U5L08_07370 [Xanthomonadales bacterium]|nr:hypothetical protein [Xanthomonadales bacterium]